MLNRPLGDLTLNFDAIEDDDIMEQIAYIELETDWRREKWPDGFIWDCCNQNCNNKGCVVRKHLPVAECIAKARGFIWLR